VVPLLLAAVAGIAVGMVRRPLGAHLADPRVLVPGLAAGAVALHLALGLLSPAVAGPLLGLSLFLLTGFGLLNLHLVGMGVLTLGMALNAAVVLVNGAMPVRATAVVAAGVAEPGELVLVDLGAGRRYEATGDWLAMLGDVIPVSPIGAVLSFGDLIVLMGIGVVASDLVRYARRPQPGSSSRALRDRLAAQGVVQDRVGREALRVGDRAEHGEELHGADHVVDAEHRLGDRGGDRGDRRQGPGVAPARRRAGQRADEVLAGQRQQQRPSQLGHAADAVDEVQGLPGGLGEVDSRVEEHLLT
jgi:hypothetical protein